MELIIKRIEEKLFLKDEYNINSYEEVEEIGELIKNENDNAEDHYNSNNIEWEANKIRVINLMSSDDNSCLFERSRPS